jgi:predicted  nucleic acid-binding Zn-ribbon protein
MPEALEELGEEAVTALSLLVNEGATDNDTDDDEDESGELPTTIEGLTALVEEQKGKITKRNKSLKMAKQAQHRTQDENNTLQSQFEALETKVDGIGKPNVEAESLAKEEQEWQDRVEDDPTQAIGYMNWKNAQRDQNLASFLSQKLGQIEQNFNELKSDTDPEKLEYKSEIAQLKATPQFAHLDDATALLVAKALKATKVPGRGNISGKRVTAQAKSAAFELTDDDKRKMGFAV